MTWKAIQWKRELRALWLSNHALLLDIITMESSLLLSTHFAWPKWCRQLTHLPLSSSFHQSFYRSRVIHLFSRYVYDTPLPPRQPYISTIKRRAMTSDKTNYNFSLIRYVRQKFIAFRAPASAPLTLDLFSLVQWICDCCIRLLRLPWRQMRLASMSGCGSEWEMRKCNDKRER